MILSWSTLHELAVELSDLRVQHTSKLQLHISSGNRHTTANISYHPNYSSNYHYLTTTILSNLVPPLLSQ